LNCSEAIENGLFCYMQGVINELFGVFQMMRSNDDAFRKKVYNFYQNKKKPEDRNQDTGYSNVVLTDPLGEYKHFEKQDLEEQKMYKSKIWNKETKGDEMEEKAGSSKKKKKAVFDDVKSHF